jgi:hypothetical protein
MLTMKQTLGLAAIDLCGAVGFGAWYGSWGAGLWMGVVLLKITQLCIAGADYYGAKLEKERYAERRRQTVG